MYPPEKQGGGEYIGKTITASYKNKKTFISNIKEPILLAVDFFIIRKKKLNELADADASVNISANRPAIGSMIFYVSICCCWMGLLCVGLDRPHYMFDALEK